MLNGIEIGRLRRPHNDLKIMVLQPGFGLFIGMLGVITHSLGIFAPIVEAFLEAILKNAHIEVGINSTINFGGISCPISPKAAPQHCMSTSIFECSLHQPVNKALSLLLLHPLLLEWTGGMLSLNTKDYIGE